MNVNIPDAQPSVKGPDIEFELEDRGNAHVTIILSIEGEEPILHDERNKGSRVVSLKLKKGTYACNVYVAAYEYEGYGRTYKTKVTAKGTVVASANGSLPQGKASERNDGSFDLVVT